MNPPEPIDWYSRIQAASQKAAHALGERADVAVILGSGLGAFADRLTDSRSIPFADIPHFPIASVPGHAGRLVAGTIRGVRVIAMAGRVHGYEGYSSQEVVFPVRVLARFGIRALAITNSAGCINTNWSAGELMRITDHINLSGRNPLEGPNDDRIGPRFPDMTRAYDPRLAAALYEAAEEIGIQLRHGVYAHLSGPSYETPAEVRMLRTLGADAAGMSTVPEVIAAAHAGIPVAGISCLTNMAAGILDQPLTHGEVTAMARTAAGSFVSLLEAFLPRALAAVSA